MLLADPWERRKRAARLFMRRWFSPLCTVVVVLTMSVSASAGPKRLTAALEALRTSQKQLEDAKEPPAAFHDKSLAAVKQAIAAVEREIKAYNDAEAKAKADKSAKDSKDAKDAKSKKPADKAEAKKPEPRPAAKPKPKAEDVE